MSKTYKKTATIEGMFWEGDLDELADFLNAYQWDSVWPADDSITINSKEGPVLCRRGDLIAKGIDGEAWAIDRDIFERTYREVEES